MATGERAAVERITLREPNEQTEAFCLRQHRELHRGRDWSARGRVVTSAVAGAYRRECAALRRGDLSSSFRAHRQFLRVRSAGKISTVVQRCGYSSRTRCQRPAEPVHPASSRIPSVSSAISTTSAWPSKKGDSCLLPRLESTDGLASAATTDYGAPIFGAPTPNVVPTTIGRSAA